MIYIPRNNFSYTCHYNITIMEKIVSYQTPTLKDSREIDNILDLNSI